MRRRGGACYGRREIFVTRCLVAAFSGFTAPAVLRTMGLLHVGTGPGKRLIPPVYENLLRKGPVDGELAMADRKDVGGKKADETDVRAG